ncbi:unnamed protein product [Amoebophrya sp. A120]|nr:unnamed protein product [Amoebophrya sp. A120]|eukprot:GSA120T00001658001.1
MSKATHDIIAGLFDTTDEESGNEQESSPPAHGKSNSSVGVPNLQPGRGTPGTGAVEGRGADDVEGRGNTSKEQAFAPRTSGATDGQHRTTSGTAPTNTAGAASGENGAARPPQDFATQLASRGTSSETGHYSKNGALALARSTEIMSVGTTDSVHDLPPQQVPANAVRNKTATNDPGLRQHLSNEGSFSSNLLQQGQPRRPRVVTAKNKSTALSDPVREEQKSSRFAAKTTDTALRLEPAGDAVNRRQLPFKLNKRKYQAGNSITLIPADFFRPPPDINRTLQPNHPTTTITDPLGLSNSRAATAVPSVPVPEPTDGTRELAHGTNAEESAHHAAASASSAGLLDVAPAATGNSERMETPGITPVESFAASATLHDELQKSIWSTRYPLLPAIPAASSSSSKTAATTTTAQQNAIIVRHAPSQSLYVVPPHIGSFLKPYQRTGVRWLLTNLVGTEPPIGSLLGDDMGLGKTVQVATLLGAMYHTRNDRRFRATLIVAPPSLLDNWKQELERWTQLEVEKLEPRSCDRVLQRVNAGLCQVVLVSFGMFSQDLERNLDLYKLVQELWGLVVIDEVHTCKNPNTTASLNISKLKSRRKLGLTGTLVANNVTEVWALLRCVGAHKLPGVGTKEQFDAKYSQPIQEGLRKSTDVFRLAARDRAAKEFQDVILKRHILRRTKAEANLNLPGKRDRILACPLSDLQKQCYQNLLRSSDVLSILAGGKSVTVSEVLARQGQQQKTDEIIAEEAPNADLQTTFKKCACNLGPKRCDCNMGVIWRNMHDKCKAEDRPCKSWLHPYKCHWLAVMSWLQKISNHLDLLQTKLYDIGHEDEINAASHGGACSFSRSTSNVLAAAPHGIANRTSTLSKADQQARAFELKLCSVVFAGTELEPTIQDLVKKHEKKEARREGRRSSTTTGVISVLDQHHQEGASRRALNLISSAADRDRAAADSQELEKRISLHQSSAGSLLRNASVKNCGKLQMLLKLLRLWQVNVTEENKVLVFSRSTKLLDIIETTVKAHGFRNLRLDGSTPAKLRQGLCQEFNTNPQLFLFLISTRAGGVGLNLTAANKVVIFDPDWNPCMDLQCQDRAFRIGQSRHVDVYRLLAAGTVEEQMYYRQVHKQQISRLCVDNVKTTRRLDSDHLDRLDRFFRFDDEAIGKTFDAIPRGQRQQINAGGSGSSHGGLQQQTVNQDHDLRILDDERDMDSLQQGDELEEALISSSNADAAAFAPALDGQQQKKNSASRPPALGGGGLANANGNLPPGNATKPNSSSSASSASGNEGQNIKNQLSASEDEEKNILQECGQFLHDNAMRRDSQEEVLALLAEDADIRERALRENDAFDHVVPKNENDAKRRKLT